MLFIFTVKSDNKDFSLRYICRTEFILMGQFLYI